VKALTVRQPYAAAIVTLGKNVENRPKYTKHRGRFAVHASTTPAHDTAFTQVETITGKTLPNLGAPRLGPAYRMGAVIGVVDLVDVHTEDDCRGACSPWALRATDICAQCVRGRCATEHAPCWHWELTNPVPLRVPVPMSGQLGLWNVSAHQEASITRQLATP